MVYKDKKQHHCHQLRTGMSAKGESRNFRKNKDKGYRPGFLERLFDIFTCRHDLDEEESATPPVGFIQLFRFGSRTDKLLVIIGVLCGILGGMVYTFPSFIIGKIATVLIQYGPGDRELLTKGYPYVFLDLSFAVVVFVLNFFQNFLLKKACTNIITNLRIEFIKTLLRQDATWLDKQKFGVLNAELTENIDVIKDGIGEKIGMVIRGFSALIGCCIFSAWVDWKVLLIILPSAPISIIFMSFMGRLLNIAAKQQSPYSERAAAILQESVINVKTVQCCNGEGEIIDRYCKILKDGRCYGVMPYFWNGLFDAATYSTLYFFYAVAF
ncbi:hypothetical protein FO519_007700 [Halicephalobus sp. NKZ332]|nr:hypothetical protein FO519_007700 [Halicephalobus sp. NKZ332]